MIDANWQLTGCVEVCVPHTRLRPMRGLKQDRSARVIIAGHAFVQNLRRGLYELAVEEPTNRRVAVAFDELVLAI
jgi:IS6 family transposase